MRLKPILFAVLTSASLAGFGIPASADNDDLKCTDADQAKWMSEDATKEMLMKQGFKEVREVEVTKGHCYEVYAVDDKGENVELYLDPTDGHGVDKED
jgi:hypothetical protein